MDVPERPLRNLLVLYNVPAEVPVKGEALDAVSEAEVVTTAMAVAQALRTAGYPNVSLYGLTADLGAFLAELDRFKPDLIFNLCEAIAGDEHHEPLVTHLLEFLGIRYTGAGTRALTDSNDKFRAKQILAAEAIPTPGSHVVRSVAQLRGLELYFPVIVKPVRENASLGITTQSVVHDPVKLVEPVAHVLEKYRQPALVERYIEGREFNISVLGNDDPWVLPIAEVDYSGLPAGIPKILFYEAKWIEDSPFYLGTPIICPARNVSPRLAERLMEVARKAYQALGCTGYARVDIRVSRAGRPYIIEVNCNPSLSPEAGLARSARHAGLEYPMLIDRIVQDALRRFPVEEQSPTEVHEMLGEENVRPGQVCSGFTSAC
jgi:D-alanine-D-alanine ligase